MPLVHHELCFGCGRTNLFGLLVELDRTAPGAVAGRCFIKQDHQGAQPRSAHEGVLAAALSEAMALACGLQARASRVELELLAPAPVGTFLALEARSHELADGTMAASASASADGQPIAAARGSYKLG